MILFTWLLMYALLLNVRLKFNPYKTTPNSDSISHSQMRLQTQSWCSNVGSVQLQPGYVYEIVRITTCRIPSAIATSRVGLVLPTLRSADADRLTPHGSDHAGQTACLEW